MTSQLNTTRGAALYVGAILGPGLLLLPGLAAAQAGPASILAWVALLALSGLFATVFAALGRRLPSAGGVMGYVTAGIGRRAGLVTGWSFLAGVVIGAPVVCLIGASYVVTTTTARAVVAAGLLTAVLALAARGLRASAAAQLLLVGLLVAVVLVAVGGSAHAAQLGHWTPFAPHGWMSVGHAAVTLMLSFAGWEAVAPLTTRFADPARQLPRVVAIALAVTTAIYLSLAVTTIAVLGPAAATDVPLAELLTKAVGSAGPAVAGVAAVVLTLGTTNAYINGAIQMVGELRNGAGRPAAFLAVIGVTGAAGLAFYGFGLVSVAAMVELPTALFLAVYLGAMAAAVRLLGGKVRIAAIPAGLAVAAMLSFCGWAVALPAAVALTVIAARRGLRSAPDRQPGLRPRPAARRATAPASAQRRSLNERVAGGNSAGRAGGRGVAAGSDRTGLRRGLRFYRDVLGLTEQAAFSSPGGRVTILAAGRATLELADPAHAAYIDQVEVGRRVAGPIRVAFGVGDSAAASARLAGAGAAVVAPPTRTPWRSLNSRLEARAGLQLTLFSDLPDAERAPG